MLEVCRYHVNLDYNGQLYRHVNTEPWLDKAGDRIGQVVEQLGSPGEVYSRTLGRVWKSAGVDGPYNMSEAERDRVLRIYQLLDGEGFTLLGYGAYSIAVQHPDLDDMVLKIETRDSAASAWWDYCARHQTHAMIPTQHLHGELLGFQFVLMDRLKVDTDRAKPLCDQAEGIDKFIRRLERTRDDGPTNQYRELFNATAERGWNAGLARAIMDLRSARDEGKIYYSCLDIHDENIMFHPKTNVPYLTDPIC